MNRIIIILLLILMPLPMFAISELTVGYYDNPPKIFKDELSNEAAGFWADVTNQIGKDANIQINWVLGSWAECMERLDSGEIDVVVDVAEIESRKASMLFSNEMMLLSWSTIFTHRQKEVSSLLDFQDKTIGVLKGSVNYEYSGGIVDLFKSFNVNVDYQEFDSYTRLLDSVVKGEIYGGVTTKDIGNLYNKRGQIYTTSFWFQPIQLKYALSINNPNAQEIILLLDQHIGSYKKNIDSIFYQSIKKFINQAEAKYFPQWAKILLGILLILLVIFYLFNRILSAKVKTQTTYLTKEISERKKAQQGLEETMNKLEELNKVKDSFLRSVSHELLTPLNSILGFSEVLINNKEEIKSEMKEDYLKRINNSGRRLLYLINNMLDTTLINSNLISIIPEKIYLKGKIEKFFANYPKSKKLKYSLQLPDNTDDSQTMITDFDILNKILIHLLDNATKFTDEGEITLGYSLEQDSVTFFVKDTGIGIAEHNNEFIFKSFTQIENNQDRLSEGSGLGLTIVQALVKSLQGEISVKSSLKQGSVFYIKFPLKLTVQTETKE